ncbi:hypothetical protein BS47DRAFT_1384071 [Hydnum rufescens UP504]|uniref:Uncharacterized protein n=1 Tax=Hydnum rufescens UP504 TaxID=1448309 RepID=A0A9P6AQM0_9AGAM|nr:hypothetical protein BS47DRAFT_1384071 [Hydnum rufescens UP504]
MDRHGEVILLLAAAWDYTVQHGAGETGGGEGSKGVKRSGMDVGLDDRRGNKTTVGKRKKAAVKSVALIWDELEDADSVDNLLSFGSQAASHDSSNSSSIPCSVGGRKPYYVYSASGPNYLLKRIQIIQFQSFKYLPFL